MNDKAHIIGRQRLNIQVSNRSEAYNIQSRVLDVFKQKVLPKMEAELDRLAIPGEVIRIDKLQLDLGDLSLANIDSLMPEMVAQKLRSAILKLIHNQGRKVAGFERQPEELSKLERLQYFLDHGILAWSARGTERSMTELLDELIAGHPEAVRRELARLSGTGAWNQRRRLVLQFTPAQLQRLMVLLNPAWKTLVPRLEKAVRSFLAEFPILSGPLEGRRLSTLGEFLLSLALAAAFPGSAEALLSELGLEAEVLPRILQSGASAVDRVVVRAVRWMLEEEAPASEVLASRLAGLPALRLAALPQRLAKAMGGTASMEVVWRALVEGQLEDLPPSGKAPAALASVPEAAVRKQAVARAIAEKLVSGEEVDLPVWLDAALAQVLRIANANANAKANANANANAERSDGRADLTAAQLLEALAKIAPEASILAAKARLRPQLSPEEVLEEEKKSDQHREKKPARKPRKPGEASEIFIENSGLVILNPFLPGFFDRLGWLEDGKLKGNEEREKAAILLQYIATGQSEVPEEHELPLNKLLAGLDIDFALRRDWQPDAETKAMADLVLDSAIHNWPKVGIFRAEELRHSFLLREGKLTESGGNWQLKVERKTLDVLLDFVPWSYGIVRLPWMKSMITVNW